MAAKKKRRYTKNNEKATTKSNKAEEAKLLKSSDVTKIESSTSNDLNDLLTPIDALCSINLINTAHRADAPALFNPFDQALDNQVGSERRGKV